MNMWISSWQLDSQGLVLLRTAQACGACLSRFTKMKCFQSLSQFFTFSFNMLKLLISVSVHSEYTKVKFRTGVITPLSLFFTFNLVLHKLLLESTQKQH